MSERVFTIDQQSFLDSSRSNLKIFDQKEDWVEREVLDTSPSKPKQSQKSYIELLDQNNFSREELNSQKLAVSIVQIMDKVHRTKSCFEDSFNQAASTIGCKDTAKFPQKSKAIVYKSNIVRSLRASLEGKTAQSSIHVAKYLQINLKKQKIQVSLDKKDDRFRSISQKSGSGKKMKLSITDKSFIKSNCNQNSENNNPNFVNRQQININTHRLNTHRQGSKPKIKQINLKPANIPQQIDQRLRKKIKLSLRK